MTAANLLTQVFAINAMQIEQDLRYNGTKKERGHMLNRCTNRQIMSRRLSDWQLLWILTFPARCSVSASKEFAMKKRNQSDRNIAEPQNVHSGSRIYDSRPLISQNKI